MTAAAWIEYLPDPGLLLRSDGRTRQANALALELAARHRLEPELAILFGQDVAPLLELARREGSAEGFLPLRTGADGAPLYRVALRRAGKAGGITAVLTDRSDESAARRELVSRNLELAVLKETGAALSSTLDLDAMAARIYETTGRIMSTVNFYVALHDQQRGTIAFPLRIENGQRLPNMIPRPCANGLTEHVLRTRQPLLLNGDVLAQAQALGLAPAGRQARSWLGVPLLAQGRAIGVIVVQDHEGTGGFDAHDMLVLTLIAGQAAAAVRNVHLLGEARSAYRELSQTQATLLQSERLRSITETVGTLNHEINNPLAAISGNAQLLLRPGGLPAGAEDKVTRILEAARRIQSVTGRMANLIQATTMSYPGNETILDLSGSVAREGQATDTGAGPEPARARSGHGGAPAGSGSGSTAAR